MTSFIFLPVPITKPLHLPSTLPALLSMTVTFSFKFFFASLLISQPLPSGIQQKPRSVREAFKVKVCTEVQNEMAHPSAPFCKPATRMSNHSLFPKRTILGKLHLSIVTRASSLPCRASSQQGERSCSPRHSRLSPECKGKAQHTYHVPHTGTASGTGFSLPPRHPSPKGLAKGGRNGK